MCVCVCVFLFQANQLILWHSYSELQVLLKLDFLQTASVRKEEMLLGLYERGALRPQVRHHSMCIPQHIYYTVSESVSIYTITKC